MTIKSFFFRIHYKRPADKSLVFKWYVCLELNDYPYLVLASFVDGKFREVNLFYDFSHDLRLSLEVDKLCSVSNGRQEEVRFVVVVTLLYTVSLSSCS